MTYTYTIKRGDRTATIKSSRKLSPEELTFVDNHQFGVPTPEPRVLRPPLPEGTLANLPGAVRETLGLEYRPESRTVGHAVYQPKGVAEHAAQAAITGPLIGLGGEAAWFAPWIGRSVMSGIIGAAQAASRGDSLAFGALLDAAVATLTEGTLAGVPKLRLPYHESLEQMAGRLSGMKRAYQWATEAPMKALEALAARLPKGKWMTVPTLGKAKVTAKEAVEGLAKLEGYEYQQARGEIVSEFNRLDLQSGVRGARGPRPYAGQAFNLRTAPERFTPRAARGMERVAETAVPALRSPMTRTIADVATTQEAAPGVPFGAVAGQAAGTQLGRLGRAAVRAFTP